MQRLFIQLLIIWSFVCSESNEAFKPVNKATLVYQDYPFSSTPSTSILHRLRCRRRFIRKPFLKFKFSSKNEKSPKEESLDHLEDLDAIKRLISIGKTNHERFAEDMTEVETRNYVRQKSSNRLETRAGINTTHYGSRESFSAEQNAAESNMKVAYTKYKLIKPGSPGNSKVGTSKNVKVVPRSRHRGIKKISRISKIKDPLESSPSSRRIAEVTATRVSQFENVKQLQNPIPSNRLSGSAEGSCYKCHYRAALPILITETTVEVFPTNGEEPDYSSRNYDKQQSEPKKEKEFSSNNFDKQLSEPKKEEEADSKHLSRQMSEPKNEDAYLSNNYLKQQPEPKREEIYLSNNFDKRISEPTKEEVHWSNSFNKRISEPTREEEVKSNKNFGKQLSEVKKEEVYAGNNFGKQFLEPKKEVHLSNNFDKQISESKKEVYLSNNFDKPISELKREEEVNSNKTSGKQVSEPKNEEAHSSSNFDKPILELKKEEAYLSNNFDKPISEPKREDEANSNKNVGKQLLEHNKEEAYSSNNFGKQVSEPRREEEGFSNKNLGRQLSEPQDQLSRGETKSTPLDGMKEADLGPVQPNFNRQRSNQAALPREKTVTCMDDQKQIVPNIAQQFSKQVSLNNGPPGNHDRRQEHVTWNQAKMSIAQQQNHTNCNHRETGHEKMQDNIDDHQHRTYEDARFLESSNNNPSQVIRHPSNDQILSQQKKFVITNFRKYVMNFYCPHCGNEISVSRGRTKGMFNVHDDVRVHKSDANMLKVQEPPWHSNEKKPKEVTVKPKMQQ